MLSVIAILLFNRAKLAGLPCITYALSREDAPVNSVRSAATSNEVYEHGRNTV